MNPRNLLMVLTIAAGVACLASNPARAASNLHLAPSLSFTDDSSANFPIAGNDLQDAAGVPDRATIIFFGTAHCWNTNREAERLVALYSKYRDRINFIVVNLDDVSSAQGELATRYFRGYIQTITVIDSHGRVIYDRAGETGTARGDASNLEAIIQSAK